MTRRLRCVPALALAVVLSGCAGPAPVAEGPTATPGSQAPTAAPASEPPSAGDGGGVALPAGIAATVSVRGETYSFPEAGASTCIVGSSVVTVIASSADPRLTLTVTWRATGGTRHVSFGNPGRPGVWQAGDSIPGASELVLEVEGRSAELSGPMRHTDESIDQVTIRVAC